MPVRCPPSIISKPAPHFGHIWCCGKRSALPIRCIPHLEQIPSKEPGLILSSWGFISAFVLQDKKPEFQFYRWILGPNAPEFKLTYHVLNRLFPFPFLFFYNMCSLNLTCRLANGFNRTSEPGVGGSNPSRRAIFKAKMAFVYRSPLLVMSNC